MRIAVVVMAPFGGILQYGGQLAQALGRRGHDVVLLSACDNELSGLDLDVAMRAVLARTPPPPGPVPRGARLVARRAGVAVRLVRAFARAAVELRRGRYDVALLCDDLNTALPAFGWLVLSRIPGAPPVAAVCHEPRPRGRRSGEALHVRSPALSAGLSRFYRRASVVLLHGERSRQEFEETWPGARTAVVPHGDHAIFGGRTEPSAEPRILFFGEWRRVKGLLTLLDAFDLLAGRMPDAALTIAGQPADVDPGEVRERLARWGDRVEIIDSYLPMEAVPAVFARSRVVAVPYLAASQSGVLHLAMTLARPVVATAVGELAETVVDGETGRVVEPGDPAALAGALQEILADPARAAAMGEAGRRRLGVGASWPQVAEAFERALAAAQTTSR